jgi:hypothetical protein
MRETKNILGGTDMWRNAEWALAVLSLISSCFAISVVPFLRKDMGERYFGWVNLYFGYSIVAGFTFFGSLLGFFIHQPMIFPQLMPMFWLAFVAASIYQRREIWRKNNAGIEWHSMYMGSSILPVPMSQEKVFKFIEPLVVFLAGRLLYTFNWQVGMWLNIAAFSLAINNHIIYYQQRQTILDMRDGQIESSYLSGAMSGKPANETCGFVVGESTRKLVGNDAKLKDAFFNLPPELTDVLDSPAEQAAK